MGAAAALVRRFMAQTAVGRVVLIGRGRSAQGHVPRAPSAAAAALVPVAISGRGVPAAAVAIAGVPGAGGAIAVAVVAVEVAGGRPTSGSVIRVWGRAATFPPRLTARCRGGRGGHIQFWRGSRRRGRGQPVLAPRAIIARPCGGV